jgi:vancomycin resistance protein YoaR
VSSTLFRAVLNTSLPITERQAHSYIVSYYGTPGLDATVYTPRPDFRFKNTTDHHILLQHRIEGTQLTYELYGTKPNIESKVIGPIVLSASPDGSMRTVVHRELYRDGEKIDTNSFYSNYRPPNTVTTNPLE